MRREERGTVQGPVKKQQPDGMSHRGGGGGLATLCHNAEQHSCCGSGRGLVLGLQCQVAEAEAQGFRGTQGQRPWQGLPLAEFSVVQYTAKYTVEATDYCECVALEGSMFNDARLQYPPLDQLVKDYLDSIEQGMCAGDVFGMWCTVFAYVIRHSRWLPSLPFFGSLSGQMPVSGMVRRL